jgi:hypothetical protein
VSRSPSTVLVCLFALAAAEVRAQARVEVQPVFGLYQGLGSWETNETQFTLLGNENVQRAQRAGFALGGAVAVWTGSRVGFRFHVLSAKTDVAVANPEFRGQDATPSRITVLGGEVLFQLRKLSGTGTQVYMDAGVSHVTRAGAAYEGFSGTKDPAGSLGLGSTFRLGNNIGLRGDVRTLLYQLGLTNQLGQRFRTKFQTDLLAYLGLVIQAH